MREARECAGGASIGCCESALCLRAAGECEGGISIDEEVCCKQGPGDFDRGASALGAGVRESEANSELSA